MIRRISLYINNKNFPSFYSVKPILPKYVHYKFSNDKNGENENEPNSTAKTHKSINVKTKQKKAEKIKKQVTLQKDTKQIPQSMKKIYKMRQEAANLEVASQAELSQSIIASQIKRQRLQVQTIQNNQGDDQNNTLYRLLVGLSLANIGAAGMLSLPFFANNIYYLGIYSSVFLYPSFIGSACISVGMNLGYLIFRQSLVMHTKIQQIKQVNITEAPYKYYFQMGLISCQFFSLAAVFSLPLVLGLPNTIKQMTLYAMLFFILSVNFHGTIQQKQFPNPKYRRAIHSSCFAMLFILSCYLHYLYSIKQPQSESEMRKRQEFKRGQDKVKNIWKIDRALIKQNSKITDILSQQNLNREDKNTNLPSKIDKIIIQ